MALKLLRRPGLGLGFALGWYSLAGSSAEHGPRLRLGVSPRPRLGLKLKLRLGLRLGIGLGQVEQLGLGRYLSKRWGWTIIGAVAGTAARVRTKS